MTFCINNEKARIKQKELELRNNVLNIQEKIEIQNIIATETPKKEEIFI